MPSLTAHSPAKPSFRAGAWCFQSLLVLVLLLPAAPDAAAHNNSVTAVDARLTTNQLSLTLRLNQPDLLQIAMDWPVDRFWFTNAQEFATNVTWISNYVRQRVTVRVDQQTLPQAVRDWPGTNSTFQIELRPGDIQPAPLTMRMDWALPAGGKELELVFNLYDKPLFSALFQILFDLGPDAMPVMHVVPGGRKTIIDLVAFTEDTTPTNAPPPPTNAVETAATNPPALPAPPAEPPAPRAIQVNPGQFVWIGFEHILPKGLDHILFVLGLFLLSARWKPLLWQVTAFTIAHSLTLALAMLGVFSLPGRVVEPLIALSISAVAIENLYRQNVSPWRWMGVFLFGLIHGFGFAGVLGEMKIPDGAFGWSLLSFNVGVELGQLAVLALAFVAVGWAQDRPWYHRVIRTPVCLLIAAIGIYWAIERVLGL